MKNQKLWREIRHISADNLRRLCIHQRWYTKGDNAACIAYEVAGIATTSFRREEG